MENAADAPDPLPMPLQDDGGHRRRGSYRTAIPIRPRTSPSTRAGRSSGGPPRYVRRGTSSTTSPRSTPRRSTDWLTPHGCERLKQQRHPPLAGHQGPAWSGQGRRSGIHPRCPRSAQQFPPRRCCRNCERSLARWQALLWAEGRRSLLVVLQAMDAGGKDGTISHVFSQREPARDQRHRLQATGSPLEPVPRLLVAHPPGRSAFGRDRDRSSIAPTTKTSSPSECTASSPRRCGGCPAL